jgi:hypothetical protein
MVILRKLIKIAISTALLNKVVRGAFTNALMKSAKWALQPSMRSSISAFFTNHVKAKSGTSLWPHYVQTLLKAGLALALLRFTKKSWIIESAGISTIGALLLSLMRSKDDQTPGKSGQRDQIIDLNEYTIIDEKQ